MQDQHRSRCIIVTTNKHSIKTKRKGICQREKVAQSQNQKPFEAFEEARSLIGKNQKIPEYLYPKIVEEDKNTTTLFSRNKPLILTLIETAIKDKKTNLSIIAGRPNAGI